MKWKFFVFGLIGFAIGFAIGLPTGLPTGHAQPSLFKTDSLWRGKTTLSLFPPKELLSPELKQLSVQGYKLKSAVWIEDYIPRQSLQPGFDAGQSESFRLLGFSPSSGTALLESANNKLPTIGMWLLDTTRGVQVRRINQVTPSVFVGPNFRQWIVQTSPSFPLEPIVKADLGFRVQTRLALSPDESTYVQEGDIDGTQPALSFKVKESLLDPGLTFQGRIKIEQGSLQACSLKITADFRAKADLELIIQESMESNPENQSWSGFLTQKKESLIPLDTGIYLGISHQIYWKLTRNDSKVKNLHSDNHVLDLTSAHFRLNSTGLAQADLVWDASTSLNSFSNGKISFVSQNTFLLAEAFKGSGELSLSLHSLVLLTLNGKALCELQIGPGLNWKGSDNMNNVINSHKVGPSWQSRAKGNFSAKAFSWAENDESASEETESESESTSNLNSISNSKTDFEKENIGFEKALTDSSEMYQAPELTGTVVLSDLTRKSVLVNWNLRTNAPSLFSNRSIPTSFGIQIKEKDGQWRFWPKEWKSFSQKVRLDNLIPGINYNVRLIPKNIFGEGDPLPNMDGLHFTTKMLNRTPNLVNPIYPSNQSVLDSEDVNFQWEIQDPDTESPLTIILYADTVPNPKKELARFQRNENPPTLHLMAGKTWYWKLQVDDGEFRVESATNHFTIAPMLISRSSGRSERGNLILIPGRNTSRQGLIVFPAFALQQTEVKQSDFVSITKKNPSYRANDSFPVERVTFYEADSYCKELGGRLPTDQEWEWAAKAGSTWWKNSLGEYAWYRDNAGKHPAKVGSRDPNPWGLHDMLGNVFEWVDGAFGEIKQIRGGSWYSEGASLVPEMSYKSRPQTRSVKVGFRCAFPVRTLADPQKNNPVIGP